MMRKYIVLGTIVGLAVVVAPAGAWANQSAHWTGTDCNYAKSHANGGGDQDGCFIVGD